MWIWFGCLVCFVWLLCLRFVVFKVVACLVCVGCVVSCFVAYGYVVWVV